MQRRQVGQAAQTEHPQEGIGHPECHRLARQVQAPRLLNQPRSSNLVTVEEESTPRTCSIKLRETGWL